MTIAGWLLAIFAAFPALAADFKVPPLTGPVVDQAGVIDASASDRIESALFALRQQGGTQINVLTVKSLEGLAIEEASIKVVDAWKLGTAKEDKGVLLLVAPTERKVRIEVGQGLEGSLTDLDSKRIISEAITPLFKKGDISGGILNGVYQIVRKTDPEFNVRGYLENGDQRREVRNPQQGHRVSPGAIIFFIIILIFMMSTSFGRAMLFGMFLSGLGGGRGGGGGGGRGSWGGGGGGFSGGGASGDW